MTKQKKMMRIAISTVILTLVLVIAASACMLLGTDGETLHGVSTVTKLDKDIENNLEQFLNPSVMYKLPDTVKDTDDISIIIRTRKASLLDAYEAGKGELTFSEYAFSEDAQKVTADILNEKSEILSSIDGADIEYSLGADYKAIFGGFEVVIKASEFESLCRAVGNRATVIVGEKYKPCETQLVENSVNVYETGIFDSSSFGYDGTGMIVAVLDTGLDYYHSAFSVNNFTADRNKLGLTFSDVEGFVSDTKANKLHSGLTAEDVYINEKIPFAFDYADGDPDVYPMTPTAAAHGTHVAGVIAGKDEVITGVAPNAQLAIMKIFSDVESSARTAWILSALEDCVVVGVDVINMSIGTSCGFSREMDREAISGVYDRIREAGISMVVAASNSFNSTYGSEKNGNLGLTSNPDSATIGSPSTYKGAMSVASISGKKTPYLLFNGKIIYFAESTDRVTEEKNFYDDILPTGTDEIEIEYVTVPGAGRSADYSGLDVAGKIVLVRRGATTFEEKANVAQSKGAVGIIIYNNVSGDIKMNVGDATLGVCSISQDDGELLASQGTGKLKLSRSQTSGPFMSDFSSWGPTPDLGIKPEITAHGGMIYSAIPGQGYDHQSGTSMACPNIAGVTALIRQYVVENFPEIANDSVKVTAFVNQLMMSTADIVYNTNGLPYAVRKQGAGLANLDNIAKTTAYILTYAGGEEMDKTKIELGDDPGKSGVYTLKFSVRNFGTTSLTYDLSAYVMTEGVSDTKTKQGETTVDELGKILDGAQVRITAISGGSADGMSITVGAGKTADVTVTVTLSKSDKEYLDESFENGMYVEGFVVLDSKDENVVDLSVPYLAFYGDWTEAPLFDLDYFATNKDELDDSIDLLDKTLPDAYASRPIGSVYDDYVSYLGSFYFVQDPSATQIAADRKYISLSNQEGSVHELSNVWAGLLRNAAKVVITITDDATGEVVFEKVETDIRKSYGDGGSIYPADIKIGFDAYEQNLKNNTRYTVKIQGYLDYGDGGIETNDNNTFEFPMVTDFEAPAVTDCEFYTEYDQTAEKTRLFAKIAVYDNHYSMALQIGYVHAGTDGYILETFDQYLTPVYSSENSTTYVIYELTDYVDDIRKGAVNKNSFTVATYDYALNTATYEIRLPDDFTSFYFEEEELTLSPNQVYTLKPLTYPDTEWTELLEYTSTNPKVAHVVNNKIVAEAPGQAVIIARDRRTNRQAMLNLTVLGEGDEGYVEYDKPVTDKFVLTGYLTNKAYFFLSTDERDIGSTGDEMKFVGGGYALSMFPSESVTLRYKLDAYFPDDVEVVATSSNEDMLKVEKVNGEWVITAQAEGYASVSLDVMMDGGSTYYSQSINVEIKNPYITTGASLTHYFGLGGRVEIPSSLAITDIGQFAFSNFDYVLKGEGDEISEDNPTATKQWFIGDNTITEIVIPEGVKTIGSYAFANLTALQKVTLPSTLERIDFGAFYGCTSLTQVVGIENVKFINRSAFENCALKAKLDLKSAVAIADRAFAGNTRLDEVILGENVQSVGAYAFAGNIGLDKVTVNAKIIKLGQYAFDRCESLAEIAINASVIPTAAFNECKSLKTIKLGADVAVISEYAFSNASATKFEVDENNPVFASGASGEYLTNKQGNEILLLAPGIKGDVVINDSNITSVGTGAFSGNANITSVSIPSVTKVGNYAFAYSERLSSITLGALTDIGDYAFFRTSINSVPSLDNVSRIGAYSFAYTDVTALDVPEGVTVGEGAFRECKSLATVTIGDDVVIERNAFRLDRETNFAEDHGSYRDRNGKLIYYYIYTSPLHSLTIGDNVKIGDSAFMGAAELETVILGNGTVIGNSAFYNAASLKNVDLSNVVSIGDTAFSGDVLYEFADQNMTEPYINAYREYNYRYYAPVLESVDLSMSEKIGEGIFEYCRNLRSVILGERLTNIPARAFNLCVSLEGIDLSKVQTIGDNAFCETKLESADLSSATTIGKYAFVYNNDLRSVSFGESVELGEGAFSYCDRLNTLNNTSALKVIGDYAFAYTAISSVDLTNTVSIGDFAFLKDRMTAFSVELGDSLEKIGENPFALCVLDAFESEIGEEFNGETFTKTIYTYDISDKVKVIDGILYRVVPNGLELVSYAGKDTTVVVAEGTVRISAQAFNGAPVEQVILPSTLESIGHKAFYGCNNLAAVTFKSYKAPVLEEEYDYSYWLSAENLPATGEYLYQDAYTGESVSYKGLGIVPYFMWNATEAPAVIYYGANFVDYVGRANGDVTMIRPSNGQGYDSFIYGKYFNLVIEGATAADQTTLEAIKAIDSLPDNITLACKDAVIAARVAYDKIASNAQRALVTNLDKLLAAEQRISDLEYIQNGDTETDTDTETESGTATDKSENTSDSIDHMMVITIALGCGLVLAIITIIVLIVLYQRSKKFGKIKKQKVAKKDKTQDNADGENKAESEEE